MACFAGARLTDGDVMFCEYAHFLRSCHSLGLAGTTKLCADSAGGLSRHERTSVWGLEEGVFFS